ncbi:MAG TPA: serine/threonine-protein kinase, partial [Vicinamibacteria bacterium]|nr:serine/threonine-protein kinase [Vicinamibacteria bacterium]
MAIRIGRTCESCGFDNAEVGQDCPLCGLSATVAPSSDAPTLAMSEATSAVEFDPAQTPVFAQRYLVRELLGKGGMGDVYRVHDTVSGRDLALKLLRREAAANASSLERFRREIAVLTRLRHPAILSILDHGVQGADLFFVCEIVHGQDLRMEIRKRGVFPVKDACAIAAVVADALAAAHAEGVVHRDVKPANIMVADDGSIRLVDFGLARPEGLDVERVTQTGQFVGTPSYMSPEQFDARTVDARSDVYSLGVVLFEMLAGHAPFSASSVMSMAMKHLKEAPPAPSVSRPDLPPWVDRLVLKCLEKEPSRRFQSAAALAEELRLPRTGAVARPRRLPSGDSVMIPETTASEWALVLSSPGEKAGWTPAMALRFEGRTYRLVRVDPPPGGNGRWTYRFVPWPEGELMRRLVDYE